MSSLAWGVGWGWQSGWANGGEEGGAIGLAVEDDVGLAANAVVPLAGVHAPEVVPLADVRPAHALAEHEGRHEHVRRLGLDHKRVLVVASRRVVHEVNALLGSRVVLLRLVDSHGPVVENGIC